MAHVQGSIAIDSLQASLDLIERSAAFQRELTMQTGGHGGLTRPMLDAVALFEAVGVGYALVGGIASMVYGRARFTLDVDFVAESGHETKLAAAPETMRRFHFDPSYTWKLYHESGVDIDLWKDSHADAIVRCAVLQTLSGRSIRIAEPHDLIAMKLRADRAQDLYDIAEILKHQPIMDDRIRERVDEAQFARFLEIRRRYASSPGG